MLFAVSTLGCPGLPIPEVGTLLRRHGVGAVQLRCAADEPVNVGLSAAARRTARRELGDEGLILLGLATYVNLTAGAADFVAHLDLAHDLGAPALRLMPGGADHPSTHLQSAAETLARVASRAAGSGVRLLVETHDAFLRGGDLCRLLEIAQAGPAVGAIWDALHPWRAGESPAATESALRPWLAELQIKDVAAPTRLRPLVPGTGAVPLQAVLSAAREGGFAGPVVLEHEARWYPDAAPIDNAIAGALRVLTVAEPTPLRPPPRPQIEGSQ